MSISRRVIMEGERGRDLWRGGVVRKEVDGGRNREDGKRGRGREEDAP